MGDGRSKTFSEVLVLPQKMGKMRKTSLGQTKDLFSPASDFNRKSI